MRLISFLGTGTYSETCYTFNDRFLETCYVSAAITKFIEAKEIILLATEEAELAHGEGATHAFESLGLPKPSICRIPSGGNSEELWEQFDLIRMAVVKDEPEQVAFDITHGFRSQPFFAAAVINYLRVTTDKVPDMYAYYGEFRKNEKNSPVWDISTFINLLDWSSALQSFMKTGHGELLAKLANTESKRLRCQIAVNRPQTLNRLVTALKAFSENIATVRVPEIITASGKGTGSAKSVLELIDASESEVEQFFKPLHPLLGELKNKLINIPSDSLFTTAGHEAMLSLAKLYVDYERYPEAAIVLREGWITTYSKPQDDQDSLLSNDARKIAEDRWNEKESYKFGDGTGELLRSVRNDIQHGGFNKNNMPASKLISKIDRLIDDFSRKIDTV